MTSRTACPREPDVFDLIWTRQWPARADAELRAHVTGCEVCSDLVLVAASIADLEDGASASVRVPEAGAVWYAAQVRARQELAERAARPVLAAELVAVAGALTAALFAWRLGAPALRSWWDGLPSLTSNLPSWRDLVPVTSSPLFPWAMAALLAWALVVPAALSLARLADRTTEPPNDRP